jgi:hypothetical protein
MLKIKIFGLIILFALLDSCKTEPSVDRSGSFIGGSSNSNGYKGELWSNEKAWEWYKHQSWLVGANFTPSTAVNQIEFWQEDTYDPETIDKELEFAEKIGFNIMRVYLHYLVWARNPAKLKERMENFLEIAEKRGIKIMFVLFDDCWGDNPDLGKQLEPVPGKHNSGWAQCPGGSLVDDQSLFPVLKAYTQDILSHFGNDERVLIWDLYNEPGNFDILERSLPLLKNVVAWAREVEIEQPITIGLWNWKEEYTNFNKFQAENSDIITFHYYNEVDSMKIKISEFEKFGKPMICTEYMARTRNNTFQTHLPVFKEKNIGAINWGLVSGKTNTIYMWDSIYTAEPDLWFHDIFRKDGTPFDPEELTLIKELTNRENEH